MTDDFHVDPATEALYEQVAAEIAGGHVKQGLWLKATVDSGGDDLRAKVIYTRFRVEQLRVERIELAAQTAQRARAEKEQQTRAEEERRLQREAAIAEERARMDNMPTSARSITWTFLLLLALFVIPLLFLLMVR